MEAQLQFIPDSITVLSPPGCYSLIIDLKRKKTIQVGKLGLAAFPTGIYVYTGSAMNGLGARLRRHCSRKKKIHWHIDHLLTLPDARIRKIILYPAAPGQECRQNNGSLHAQAQPLSLRISARPIASQGAQAICNISRKISCRNSLQSVMCSTRT